jgi:hypothetical protein
VFGLLIYQLDLKSSRPEVGDGMASDPVGQAPGVLRAAAIDGVKGHRRRAAEVGPTGGLVDYAPMTLRRVRVSDEEFHAGVLAKKPGDDAQDSALGVPGEPITQPEPGQAKVIVGGSGFDDAVPVQGSSTEGDSPFQLAMEE